MPITVSGTQITFPDATTQTTAGRPGTVTSVATGNGLQGGTITTSGTLSVACPSYNTVGSYCFVGYLGGCDERTVSGGDNYSGGNSATNVQAATLRIRCDDNSFYGDTNSTNGISGTWKWMAGNRSESSMNTIFGNACRVA